MRAERYLAAFMLFSAFDALTTWFGAKRGLVEANPVLAAKLSDALVFFGSYAAFTLLGMAVLLLAIRLESLSSAFGYFAKAFVLLKALPALNNIALLTGGSYRLVVTTASYLVTYLL